jgi:hypothetical protein
MRWQRATIGMSQLQIFSCVKYLEGHGLDWDLARAPQTLEAFPAAARRQEIPIAFLPLLYNPDITSATCNFEQKGASFTAQQRRNHPMQEVPPYRSSNWPLLIVIIPGLR